jgi:hypothetical protein
METTDLEYNRLYTSNPPNPAAADADTDERNTGLTVFLRRLANPSMPLDERLTIMGPGGGMIPNPYYNPYVTVDYIDKNPLQNTSATARGKRQPYAGFTKLQPWPNPPPELPRAVPLAADSPVANQQLDPAVVNPDPNTVHTFGVQNNPPPNLSPDFPNGRYDWLVHLDRWPVSPLELLHVSGFQPHQLTQRFVYPYDISNPVNLNAPVQAQRHMAPWFDPHRRLYRLFAFLDGMYRLNNAPPYRDAGKIDLNAINSVDVFRALCDAQPGNYFTENATTPPDDVYRIFNRMMAQRTPNVVKFPEGNFRVPGPNDRPFLGTATGPMVTTTTASAVAGPPAPPAANAPEIIQVTSLSGTAAGVRWAIRPGSWVIVGTGNMAGSAREPVYVTAVDNTVMPPTFTAIFNQSHPMGSPVAPVGIEDTWLRSYGDPSQPAQQRLFEVPPKPAAVGAPPPDHPYLRYELMRKIANNITTRSNTFAVWVTVGFFEVVDDTTVPPKLGAEIGRDQGRHVRHRFFAIVDRSNLQLWETFSQNANPITLPAPPAQQLVTGVITIDPTQIQGFASGVLQVGMPLYIDVGQNQEKVIVTKIAQNANPALQDLTVIFTKNHAARFLVRAFGNPGPQPRFRPANHPEIVRYFTVIE